MGSKIQLSYFFTLLKTNESSKVICENETLMRGEITGYPVETPLLFESIKTKIYEVLIYSTCRHTDDIYSYENLWHLEYVMD